MERRAVKRRGAGRPNRGGGRHNRRGRGTQNPRPAGPSVSARKGGAALYDDDDMYDFDNRVDDSELLYQNKQQNNTNKQEQFHGNTRGTAPGRGHLARGRLV